jgi:transcriptional regulator with XRE-family HTH domain
MADESTRDEAGGLPLNQVELAEKLGVTQPTVSRWFSGERKLPVNILLRISEITGLSLEQIAGQIKRPLES